MSPERVPKGESFSFADGNRLRASSIPGRRRGGPSIDEWAPEDGVDRCDCGCKYWRDGRCIDCGDRLV